jgi:hypothetical protein
MSTTVFQPAVFQPYTLPVDPIAILDTRDKTVCGYNVTISKTGQNFDSSSWMTWTGNGFLLNPQNISDAGVYFLTISIWLDGWPSVPPVTQTI